MDYEHLINQLPVPLREAALQEVTARGFLPAEVRWLAALLTAEPLTPAPAAAAMVERTSSGPLGVALNRLERDLDNLPAAPEGLSPSERRCLRVVLSDLRRRVDERLAHPAATGCVIPACG